MATILPIPRRFSSEFQETFRCSSSSKNTIFSKKKYQINESMTKMMNRRVSFSKDEDDHGNIKRCNQCLQANRIEGLLSKDGLSPVFYASKQSDSIEKHRSSLEIYLEKVKGIDGSDESKMDDHGSQVLARKELGLLEKYLNALKEDASGNSEDSVINQQQGKRTQTYRKNDNYKRKTASFPMYDEKESGYLYLISTLVSINIAVFLFEIASPVKGSYYNLYSLPMMYGAKVNDLIMLGEWWRLLTPMFLHTGFLHIALGSWVLLSFGPQVCKGYGPFTFLLIFILGGISGNFSSFLHTTEPTVGGSGPFFAVIGAWLVYQIQNKDVITKELSDTMFQKAILATTLNFLLGNFGPMDNWTSLGAAITGIIYGFFTCPMVQVDNTSGPTSTSQKISSRIKEEIILNNTQAANPYKSLFIFTLFVSVFCSLLFLTQSSLDSVEIDELIQIIE